MNRATQQLGSNKSGASREGEAMNEQKHTPGLWQAVARPDDYRRDAGTWWIAGPLNNDGVSNVADVSRFRVDEQQEANAALIAAAPDLLAALKEARDHLDYCNYGDAWESECARSCGLPQRLDDAINKAEGRA